MSSHITRSAKQTDTPPPRTRRSIRLTIKSPPARLRELSVEDIDDPMTPSVRANTAARSRASAPTPSNAPRASRNRKPVVDESTSSDEEIADDPTGEEEEEEEGEDDDGEGEEEDEDEDEDAEGEEEDAEGEDVDMTDAAMDTSTISKMTTTAASANTKKSPGRGAKSTAAAQNSSAKATNNNLSEDDDLSDPESVDEDAIGEEEEEEDDGLGSDDDGGDESNGSNDDVSFPVSRGDTPDLSKLTRRQRAAFEDADEGLIALSNEAQKKKHLTAEEHAMRRAEMARRRKNLSEKRNEEEKMDTINRLLKKQAPKRRGRAPGLATTAANGTTGDGDGSATPAGGAQDASGGGGAGVEYERANPIYVRWVNGRGGSRVGVAGELVEGGEVGRVWRGG